MHTSADGATLETTTGGSSGLSLSRHNAPPATNAARTMAPLYRHGDGLAEGCRRRWVEEGTVHLDVVVVVVSRRMASCTEKSTLPFPMPEQSS